MALYPYRCLECGDYQEVYQSISEYSAAPRVPVCSKGHGLMSRHFTVPMMAVDFQAAIISPVDGTVLDSRAKHREYMKRNNFVLYDDVAPDVARVAREREKQAVADVKESLIAATHMVEAGHKPQVATELIPT